MRVVLDTNVFLISLPKRSQYRVIFDALLSRKIELIITQDILSEYVEIIGEKASPTVANNVAELLINLPNIQQVEVFYRWDLIKSDKEDNKFVDAAVSGNADFIVSNDRHFDVLQKTEFPPVKCISSSEFMEILAGT